MPARTKASARPPTTATGVVTRLRTMASAKHAAGMAHFGIRTDTALGISVPALRSLAREIGRDHVLAADVWRSGIHEARILACMIEEPARVTSRQLDAWVRDIDSWDVCDGFAALVAERPFAWTKVRKWSARRDEFVRRAAFATIATLAIHDKAAGDEAFLQALGLVREASTDDRNFVKKAVNWALRQIGKRNPALNAAAIATAEDLRLLDSRAARWIAADALRELRSAPVQTRLRAKPSRTPARTARRIASP